MILSNHITAHYRHVKNCVVHKKALCTDLSALLSVSMYCELRNEMIFFNGEQRIETNDVKWKWQRNREKQMSIFFMREI